jgi:hypothetical protein
MLFRCGAWIHGCSIEGDVVGFLVVRSWNWASVGLGEAPAGNNLEGRCRLTSKQNPACHGKCREQNAPASPDLPVSLLPAPTSLLQPGACRNILKIESGKSQSNTTNTRPTMIFSITSSIPTGSWPLLKAQTILPFVSSLHIAIEPLMIDSRGHRVAAGASETKRQCGVCPGACEGG